MRDAEVAVPLVLDTNIVLDLLVFGDAATEPLRVALAAGKLEWLATAEMRDELVRVLDYPALRARLAAAELHAADVLASFDRCARLVHAPGKAPVACADCDDQKFIDLAVQHECLLLSKDAAVLALRNKLAAYRVSVVAALPPTSSYIRGDA